jgi:phosphatidylserine decarboxylase
MNQRIKYIKRHSDSIIEEIPPGSGFLRFLYGNPIGKIALHSLIKRKFLSSIAGNFMNSGMSQKRINSFIEAQELDMSDYVVPQSGFNTFNEFFYRNIKKEKRPIGNGVVSPADGKLLVFESIRGTNEFFIKGQNFTAASFFQDKSISNKYENGSLAIIRLAPTDYHRFHFPVSGKASQSIRIKGHYFSVSPLALRKSLEIFCQNIREYSIIKSNEFGEVAYSEVGATMVGSIIQTYEPNTHISKGDEKGYFAFGGSTILLFFEKGKIKFNQDLLDNTKNGFETEIKMGETIANG